MGNILTETRKDSKQRNNQFHGAESLRSW